MRLVISDLEHFNKVVAFAAQVGAMDKLISKLSYLSEYNPDRDTRAVIFPDWAPNSFAFVMEEKQIDGTYQRWFNGGLIYSGPGQPLDGSHPALTVSLDPEAGKQHNWSVHT